MIKRKNPLNSYESLHIFVFDICTSIFYALLQSTIFGTKKEKKYDCYFAVVVFKCIKQIKKNIKYLHVFAYAWPKIKISTENKK